MLMNSRRYARKPDRGQVTVIRVSMELGGAISCEGLPLCLSRFRTLRNFVQWHFAPEEPCRPQEVP
jgi:hypothetical protein